MLAIGKRVVDEDVAKLVAVSLAPALLIALVLLALQVLAASFLANDLELELALWMSRDGGKGTKGYS